MSAAAPVATSAQMSTASVLVVRGVKQNGGINNRNISRGSKYLAMPAKYQNGVSSAAIREWRRQ